jgi:uncharacterized protein DUF3644
VLLGGAEDRCWSSAPLPSQATAGAGSRGLQYPYVSPSGPEAAITEHTIGVTRGTSAEMASNSRRVEEACLAVRMYDDPAEARAFEAFVIHMHLAWLYLLHAEFLRDGTDFRYWDKKFKNRLLRVDGEPKRWELERCLAERWEDRTDPVRANLSLFIRLRNRLEHRHAHADAALMFLSGCGGPRPAERTGLSAGAE